ncbi:hypothetical protein [Photobacterium leiognathi]|uniref:hypothetical protein n=1 Tax=Photobacterium leiognathi TaxID=553611 RepID=UPI002739A1CC|nr:hypothetical protein [Photobacterium leiognathi]
MANLLEYDDCVTDYLKKIAPWAKTVLSYPEEKINAIGPAIFWGVTSIAPAGSNGSGEMDMQLTVTVLVAVSTQKANSEIHVRDLATYLIANIHDNRLDLGAGYKHATVTRSESSEFEPNLAGFSVWSIEFEQVITIGANKITATEFAPGKVFVGLAPDIGAAHVDDYELVYEKER